MKFSKFSKNYDKIMTFQNFQKKNDKIMNQNFKIFKKNMKIQNFQTNYGKL